MIERPAPGIAVAHAQKTGAHLSALPHDSHDRTPQIGNRADQQPQSQFVPYARIASITLTSACPFSVSEYSTFGGTSA